MLPNKNKLNHVICLRFHRDIALLFSRPKTSGQFFEKLYEGNTQDEMIDLKDAIPSQFHEYLNIFSDKKAELSTAPHIPGEIPAILPGRQGFLGDSWQCRSQINEKGHHIEPFWF